MKKNLIPILVVVGNGRYDCFGLTDTLTPRDKLLMKHLQSLGGVNENTAAGHYYFNVMPKNGQQITSLALIPEPQV